MAKKKAAKKKTPSAMGRSPLTAHQAQVKKLIAEKPPPKKIGGRPPAGRVVMEGGKPRREKTSDYPLTTLRLPPDEVARLKAMGRFMNLPMWRVTLRAMDALEASWSADQRTAFNVMRGI